MSVVLIFTIIFLVAILAFRFTKYAIYLFIFLIPFSPRYIGIALGDGVLSLKRILIIEMLLLLFLIALKYPHVVMKNLRYLKSDSVFKIITLYLAAKFLSTSMESLGNLVYFFDELIASYCTLFLLLIIVKNIHEVKNVLTCFLLGIISSAILVAIELMNQSPVLAFFAASGVDSAREFGQPFVRDGAYRVVAGYSNPLLFAEFLCITFPFVLFLWKIRNRHRKCLTCIIALLLFFPLLVLTGSRAGLLIGFFSVLLLWFQLVCRKFGGFGYQVLVFLLPVFVSLALTGVYFLYQSTSLEFSQGDSSQNSLVSRLRQFEYAVEVFRSHPLLGVGMTQNLIADIDEIKGLDNYWLRVFFEGGLIALFLYALLAYKLIIRGLALLFESENDTTKLLAACWVTSVISFFMWKFFVSIPDNNIYLYTLIALLFVFEKNVNYQKNIRYLRCESYTNP